MTLWWLSFCDPNKPKGQTFLGECMVEVESPSRGETGIAFAVEVASIAGCNPGGDILGWAISLESAAWVSDQWKNRLLSKGEIATFNAEIRARRLN